MNQPKTSKDTNPKSPGFNLWWLYLILLMFILSQYFFNNSQQLKEITFQDFQTNIFEHGALEKLEIINKEKAEIYIKESYRERDYFSEIKVGNSGPHYYIVIGSLETFENRVLSLSEELRVQVDIKYINRPNIFKDVLVWIIPFVIIVALWIFLLRRVSGGGMAQGGNPFDFGKSKVSAFDPTKSPGVTFDDVAGHNEAKVEIMEIVDFLRNPQNYTTLGAKIPKGVILAGPPGTGKTLLARAVAGEAQVPFFSISGSEFVEMFVGVGASRVRDLFKKAKETSPSIIFIDEIDAIGRARGNSLSMRSNDERESTLNQLLAEMDGFEGNEGVIVLAATNRQDILDSALLRAGRFDRHIYLELPNQNERIDIFKVHLRKIKTADDINIELMASQTPGFSGADIANICNEAALIAARHKGTEVHMHHFGEAIDRVIAGLEKRSKIISPEEKKRISIHESGHATASWHLKYADSLVKVSIIPRGKSLGAAWYQPKENVLMTFNQFFDKLCTLLAGRAAEELIFSEVSSGALDDLEKVTKLAYTMVSYYGLNKTIGNISFYNSSGQYEQSFQKPYSEETANKIDQEVKKLIDEAYKKVYNILTDNKNQLLQLAALLEEKEMVFAADLEMIFGERPKI